jgi:lipopolysaccharide transport system permease protein
VIVAVGCAAAGYSVAPGWQVLLVPVVAALIGLTATGVGTWLAAVNVEYRDVRYVVPFFIQLGMFATPTIYMRPTGAEGGLVRFLLTANPLTSLVETFRAGVVGGPVPWAGLVVAAAVAVAVFVSGCLYFRRAEDRFADVI